MAELKLSPRAIEDMQQIREYISGELQNPQAAANTVSKLTGRMRRLISYPNSGAPLSGVIDTDTDYRFLVSGHYLIFYRYREKDNTVLVSRVLYGRRDYLRLLFNETADEIE